MPMKVSPQSVITPWTCSSTADLLGASETLMEAAHSTKHPLAIGMQLLQLILDSHSIRSSALLDQVLSEHDQLVDFRGVQGDLLLEVLDRETQRYHRVARVKRKELHCTVLIRANLCTVQC